ncbi:C6 finger domain [Mycena sanguinolenta]|uniref:C6 finger domain n=1 Tax=Mycena sanguinolenta TaxID=230812 RepID=A0A8H6XL39_9AGAR|nr:C6 finger domain [Mycena sanguinolenta]
MSTFNPAANIPQNNAPFSLRRRRTVVACVNCRKRKLRCITTEQPPQNPCARCTKKSLFCEYVSIDSQDDDDPTDVGLLAPPATSTSQGRPWTQPSSWVPTLAPSHGFSQGPGTAPQLPYTIPPPPNSRPRYSGTSYPDLSLSGSASNQQDVPTRFYSSSPASNPIVNHGYNLQPAQAYQYMGEQPGIYSPGNGRNPPHGEQMPYYAGDMTMPEYGWHPQPGSSR